MLGLPTPPIEAILFEDKYLYVCLASYPLSKGHTVVVWKDNVKDVHSLKRNDYEHLMRVVNDVRDALLKTLDVEKVYLMYLDEVNHVHWHLIPRYEEKGYNLLKHKPALNTDFSLKNKIKHNLKVSF